MSIEWNPAYATGEKRVDNQHKKLFECVNTIEKLLEADTIDAVEVENIVVFLDIYINTHFAYEELCMTLHKCRLAEKNKLAHDKFLKFYESFYAEYEEKGADRELLVKLNIACQSWLVNHICRIDIYMREHML